jgi:hypothetical protein
MGHESEWTEILGTMPTGHFPHCVRDLAHLSFDLDALTRLRNPALENVLYRENQLLSYRCHISQPWAPHMGTFEKAGSEVRGHFFI